MTPSRMIDEPLTHDGRPSPGGEGRGSWMGASRIMDGRLAKSGECTTGRRSRHESLRGHGQAVYRRDVAAWTMTRRAVSAMGILAMGSCMVACTSVDPGPNFVVPNSTFDPDYFYCHVEPQYIMGA